MNSYLKSQFDGLENFAIVIACCGHDIAHPGLSNRFLVNNKEELSITYNDVSVLESMHSAVTFQTMRDQNAKANVLECFSNEDQTLIRKIIIDMILETDMARHFDSLAKFRSKTLSMPEFCPLEDFEQKLLVLKTLIKCADVGHSSKD